MSVPLPLSGMVWMPEGTSSWIVREPVLLPNWLGEKTIRIVQLPPGGNATAGVQLLVLKKSPLVSRVKIWRFPAPVLVRVTTCTLLKVLGNWFPKVKPELDRVAALAAFTVSAIITDVLSLKFSSPAYTAVMECGPSARVDVGNVANPNTSTGKVPNIVEPSKKLTLPVGFPVVVEAGLAVNFTAVPNPVDVEIKPGTSMRCGLLLTPTAVVLGALVTVNVPLFAVIV
jgi:hypothetical protein